MAAAEPTAPRPYVREELDALSLHFSMAAIQSRMRLDRPAALELDYTRLMMGWLLLRPAAERLAMIGLGGGSIAKFCHRHLARTSMLVVEIDPAVIALRERFRAPPDDARLRVVAGDGARFVAETDERFDVLLVDAFDADGLPPSLATARFCGDCADVLGAGGLLVMNLHAGDPLLPVQLERLGAAFPAGALRVDDRDGSNCIVFASRDRPLGDHVARAARAASAEAHLPAALDAEGRAQLRGAFARIGHCARALR